jgi:hypothetical protein
MNDLAMQNDQPSCRVMFVNCELYGRVIGIKPICHGGSGVLHPVKWMFD